MRSAPDSWRGDLIWWLGIAAATGAAFWIGNGPRAGLIAGGWMLLITAVVGVGRRWSDAIRIVGGAGDERNRNLYTRATAVGGSVLAIAIPGWWLVTVARGEPDRTLLALWLLFGVSSVGAAVYYSRQS